MTTGDLFATQKAPRISRRQVQLLLECLDGQGWRTARGLRLSGLTWNDRTLRAMAAESHGQIISGQRGYARTDQSSVEDVNHAAAWLLAQAKKMEQRAREIQRAMHAPMRKAG